VPSDNAVSSDNAYVALSEGGDDVRWAYGTGFADPLEGVDTAVPAGTDAADLTAYCLMLGDDALIMSHRLQQCCTNAPELEDEVALANIALDLLGQARLLLSRAAAAEEAANGTGGGGPAGDSDGPQRGEDFYAFFRAEHEFRNVRLAELDCGDFGELIAWLLVFAAWRLAVLRQLTSSRDPVLAAIAAKGVKEVTYHRDYAAQWLIRLGDGTAFSRERAQAGLAAIWPYVAELFTPHEIERRLAAAGVAADPAGLRGEFDDVLAQVLPAATLEVPDVPPRAGAAGRTGRDGVHTGRDGVHTEAMGYLLAELQSVARADPEATW
jgi:ring-1,2-phenylacetyl-CoA epoxidase subunit PaaC